MMLKTLFILLFFSATLSRPSVTNNSVGSQTAAAGYMGAVVVAHVARSGRLRTNAVICN